PSAAPAQQAPGCRCTQECPDSGRAALTEGQDAGGRCQASGPPRAGTLVSRAMKSLLCLAMVALLGSCAFEEVERRPEDPAARQRELFYIDSLSAPLHRGTRYFYSRRHANKEKGIVYWKEKKTGAEKVLLDPNAWTADGSDSLGGWWPTHDGKRVAYNVKK